MPKSKSKKLVTANIVMWGMTALYTASPIDVIPDLIPLLGWADDGAGWLATLTFTAYTLWKIRKHGGLAALRAEGPPEGAPILPKAAPSIPGYEPMSYEELKAL
jgi:hypothetical protein